MAKLVWIIQITAVISAGLVQAEQKIAGPFYCVNEGFFPRVMDNELVEYVTDIKTMKDNYEDKRMYGKFIFKQNIKNIRGTSTVYKETATRSWQQRGMPIKLGNLCNMPFDMGNLKNCLSDMWKDDPCTLYQGTYYLKNWTVEEDFKKSMGNKMFYGRYKFELNIQGEVDTPDGPKTVELPFDFRVVFKDETLRTTQGAGKGKEEKEKKKKEKKN